MSHDHDHAPRPGRQPRSDHAAPGNAPGVSEYWRSPDPDDEPEPAGAGPQA